ncbi:MAG: hypothetical protein ACYDCK_03775 [Thermoplasmatota archaeon]
MRTSLLALAVIAVIASQSAVDAANTASYVASSQATLKSVSTPLKFVAGNNTNASGGQTSTTYSSLGVNKTSFTMSISGPKSKTTAFADFGRATHTVASATKVTYTAAQDTNAQLTAFTITFRAGSTQLGVLDLKVANPTVAFTMPASAQTIFLDASITTTSSGSQTGSATVATRFAP